MQSSVDKVTLITGNLYHLNHFLASVYDVGASSVPCVHQKESSPPPHKPEKIIKYYN